MRTSRPFLFLALAAGACSTVGDDIDRQLLQPPPGWLAEPHDVGLAAEPFELALHAAASLTGFWIPNPAAAGRTVVLLHDERTNVSVLHPYYTFLHAAGFQVLVVDPRGFGRSVGRPSLQAWLYDLPPLFDWLARKPGVDPARIAVFGSGLGSVAAMWLAKGRRAAAVVFEHLPSLRDVLRTREDGSARSAFAVGMLEFAGLPEDVEPDENAPRARVPALFVTTEHEPRRDRSALLRAFEAYAGPRELWVVPEAGPAPNAMLTHDGEYQRHIAAFLRGALGGPVERIDAAWREVEKASDGGAFYEIELLAVPGPPAEPWAVEACAVLPDGSLHTARTWLEGERATVRLRLPQAPRLVAASRVYEVAGDDALGFHRVRSHLSRSAAAAAPLWPRIEALRHGTLAGADLDTLGAGLLAAEAGEPFHARLAAELCDVYAALGLAWSGSGDEARRAQGRAWLQRAVASVPPQPKTHVWPGPAATYGFAHGAAVAAAARRLAELDR